jgi:hypothetical protein
MSYVYIFQDYLNVIILIYFIFIFNVHMFFFFCISRAICDYGIREHVEFS